MKSPRPRDPIARVDWMLAHMKDNLHKDLSEPRMWQFELRPRSITSMQEIAQGLRKLGYQCVEEDAAVETTFDARGRQKDRVGPCLWAYVRGAFKAGELKKRVRSFVAIAKRKRIRYEGVQALDLDEFEMIYGPPQLMSVEDAAWRLKHLTDVGVKRGAAVEYCFGLRAKDVKVCLAGLKQAGLKMINAADADSDWDVDVVVKGKNNEAMLRREFAAMEQTARKAGAVLGGVLL